MSVWDELAGQEAVVAQLRKAVAGSMTHAWLFTGPPGSGRSVAARAFAAALLKAIEEPAPRTVWLLCSPSAEDLVTTIRSRCRVMTLRVPPSEAVAKVLAERDGVDYE